MIVKTLILVYFKWKYLAFLIRNYFYAKYFREIYQIKSLPDIVIKQDITVSVIDLQLDAHRTSLNLCDTALDIRIK